MAKKVLLKNENNIELLPITRGELVIDSSGKEAFRSAEFLATTSQPGLMSAADKFKIDNIEGIVDIANDKVSQVNTTTSDVYRLLFSETADDTTRTEGARKSAKLTFNPSTGVLSTSVLVGNLDGTYVNKLTGYSKATLISDITSEDTLINALGKVELRAEVAYNLIQGAYDGDGTIENLAEILKVLEGISDTETIQAIIGKYLPLSGGTLTGDLTINKSSGQSRLYLGNVGSVYYDTTEDTTVLFNGNSGYPALKVKGGADAPIYRYNYTDYILIHSGNIGLYNSGSASKLNDNTEYTAWGRTYFKNGVPQNVSGTLYLDANYNYFVESDSDGLYMYNKLGGPNYIKLHNSGKIVLNGGNALIGTTTDNGAKLQVNGTIDSVDSATFGGVLVSKGGRFRINTSNSVNSFGYLKATAYTSALNRAVLDIGSNYGGTSNIASESVDVTALSIYRGVVGVGRAYTYDELYANYNTNTKLYVDGCASISSTITASSFIKAGSSDSYVLLGAGGHKAESSLSVNYANNASLLSNTSLSNSNGSIPKLIDFPAYSYFGSSTDTYDYLQNVVKWIYDNANYGGKTYLLGVGNPNSLGMMNIQLCGTSGKNSDGWPRYCSGTFLNLGDSAFDIFGTVDYHYYRYRLSVDGHGHRITKLHRRDASDDYSLQHHWTGSYWYLRGYLGDSYHAGVQVEYANSAGSASTATYATNSTYLYASDSPYRYGDSAPYYMRMRYNVNGDSRWYLSVYPETPKPVAVDHAYRADMLYGYSSNPNNSHPGHGARVFYSWDTGQAGNATAGYSNGITIGSHVSDQAYGFQIVQNMLDDRTYTRRYNSGWQSWKTLAWTSDIPTVTDYYWADQRITSSAVYTASPTLSTLRVQGSGESRATIYMVSASDVPNDLWFGAGGQFDWSLTSRNSSEDRYFGLYNNHSLGWAFTVDKSNNRFKVSEWIQFESSAGLYWPNTYGAHFYPNDTSSYGQFRLSGSKSGYSGIHFGGGTGYLTLMDNGSDKGAYQENWGWLWYFNARNDKLSLRCHSDYGADVNINGSVRTNSTIYSYGLYHLSYGSSAYALTSDGGAAHIGSMSVNYANSASTVTVHDSNSNSTYRMVWHSGNTLYGTGGIYCNPSTYYMYANSFNCGDWFRSSGSTGWYNITYAGGIYMEDSTWVRIYNGKKFYVSNGSSDAIYSTGGVYVAGAVHAYANYLKSTCNDKTITIGSQNSRWCHYDTTAPAHWFNVAVYSAGGFYEYSDETLKDFHDDIKVDFEKLKTIPKKYFNFKTTPDKIEIGTSAQAVQNIYPELVHKNADDTLGVDYGKLSVLALKGIDELYELLLAQQEEIKELRNKLHKLEYGLE